jgi:hypothetical protein
VRQRPLTLPLRLLQLSIDINVERLFLNHGCLKATIATLTLKRTSLVQSTSLVQK